MGVGNDLTDFFTRIIQFFFYFLSNIWIQRFYFSKFIHWVQLFHWLLLDVTTFPVKIPKKLIQKFIIWNTPKATNRYKDYKFSCYSKIWQ